MTLNLLIRRANDWYPDGLLAACWNDRRERLGMRFYGRDLRCRGRSSDDLANHRYAGLRRARNEGHANTWPLRPHRAP